jgi:hypothetical protein
VNENLLRAARLLTDSLRLAAPPADIRARLAAAREMDWPLLAHHADGHTLTPLLYDIWRQAGALDFIPADIRERFARAYHDNATRNTRVRQDLLDAHQLLTLAAVPHIVLKGWPLVERLYPDPAHRYLSDHDFLVPADRAQIGHQALLASGFQPLPPKDEWIEKHLPSVWRNDGYVWNSYLYDPDYPRPVELHLRLWEQGWRGLSVRDLSDLWAEAQTVMVAGVPMQVLSDENTVIHLAMHFAGHLVEREARLNQLLDVARFSARAAPLDWERVTARAAASRVGRFVYASLFLAREIFDSPLPPACAWQTLESQTPRALREWLAQYGVADALMSDYRRREKGQGYRLTFLSAQSFAERLGILRFAALPPVGQLLAKYNVRQRWLAPLLYPLHLAERVGAYGREMLKR